MKLALVLAVYRRHDLESIVIERFKDQSQRFGFEIIIAGSEGAVSQKLAEGCHYIETPNYPVSNKHNALIKKAKELDVDGVVLMGSDDLVCDNYWKWIMKFTPNEERIIGLKDLYFYSTTTKKLYYWSGYQSGKQTAGAGRFFSRYILEHQDWKLWDDGHNKGLDSNCNSRYPRERGYTMQESGVFLVDVKHSRSITSHLILELCEASNKSIMAKRVTKKTVDQIDKLETPETVESVLSELDPQKMYVFISNGKHKNLPEGLEVEETGEICAQLMVKGYGQIKA